VEAEDQFERRESRRRLIVATGQLPPKQRAVFVLRDVFGLSARETGEMLGTSVVSVNSSLQRARAALRVRLASLS
jgi:RNA polymerase sigma-70 factor (ECF subfamily)